MAYKKDTYMRFNTKKTLVKRLQPSNGVRK